VRTLIRVVTGLLIPAILISAVATPGGELVNLSARLRITNVRIIGAARVARAELGWHMLVYLRIVSMRNVAASDAVRYASRRALVFALAILAFRGCDFIDGDDGLLQRIVIRQGFESLLNLSG
jgi:hypothetical protein